MGNAANSAVRPSSVSSQFFVRGVLYIYMYREDASLLGLDMGLGVVRVL